MSRLPYFKRALVAVSLAVAGAASAGGDAAAGKEKAGACAACHGPEGISIAGMWPNLAGQYEDYLAMALQQYQNGKRKNAVMIGMAAGLSKQDIADLAAYYASLPGLESID